MPGDDIIVGFDGSADSTALVFVSRDGIRFVDVGHTNEDGVTYIPPRSSEPSPLAPYASKPPTRATAGGILTQIDAAVALASAVADLCACGCRRHVPPDGPSPYFFSQSCQHRWHDRNVDNPQEVYNRRDPAGLLRNPGEDTPTPTRGRPAPELDDDDPPPPPIIAPCADVHGTAYRRLCTHCDTRVIPQVYQDDPTSVMGGACAGPLRLIYPQPRLQCPTCEQDLPGPAYIAAVHDHGNHLVLELRDADARVQHRLHVRQIQQATDPRRLIDTTWADLERQLNHFLRAWHGRRQDLPRTEQA